MTQRGVLGPVLIKPLLSRRDFPLRLLRTMWVAFVRIFIGLGLGIIGYRYIVGQDWIDALLNASMIPGGGGPVNPSPTVGGNLFASAYALFSGLNFVAVAAIFVSPILRRTLHHFHLDDVIDETLDTAEAQPTRDDKQSNKSTSTRERILNQ